ncbi:MAG TPA: dTDP-4-dehydrorhamnose reductase, partial [Rhodothermia bacterium]|nr:dTDP-4-dehydrorhamnose reductase [Rhodothermia bacterium]
ILAETAANFAARFVHVSTDFVFDGAVPRPYDVDAVPAPLSVYGRTKLEGENIVRAVTAARTAILRTAWVYDAAGRNFLTTMLRLMRERRSVAVVADQVGTPTAADSVADALWQIAIRSDTRGIFHWTDAGVATWYDFAVAIAEEAAAIGLLPSDIEVTPIATSEYPTAAQRPGYSVLDKRSTATALGLKSIHWRRRLRTVLREFKRA